MSALEQQLSIAIPSEDLNLSESSVHGPSAATSSFRKAQKLQQQQSGSFGRWGSVTGGFLGVPAGPSAGQQFWSPAPLKLTVTPRRGSMDVSPRLVAGDGDEGGLVSVPPLVLKRHESGMFGPSSSVAFGASQSGHFGARQTWVPTVVEPEMFTMSPRSGGTCLEPGEGGAAQPHRGSNVTDLVNWINNTFSQAASPEPKLRLGEAPPQPGATSFRAGTPGRNSLQQSPRLPSLVDETTLLLPVTQQHAASADDGCSAGRLVTEATAPQPFTHSPPDGNGALLQTVAGASSGIHQPPAKQPSSLYTRAADAPHANDVHHHQQQEQEDEQGRGDSLRGALRGYRALLELLHWHQMPFLHVDDIDFDLFAALDELRLSAAIPATRSEVDAVKSRDASTVPSRRIVQNPLDLLSRLATPAGDTPPAATGVEDLNATQKPPSDAAPVEESPPAAADAAVPPVYTPDNLFAYITVNIFFRYSFIDRLDLNVPKLLAFVTAVQAHYLPSNPYHNALHAADVTHSCHAYLMHNNVFAIFFHQEILCLLLAAMVHDLGHLGVSNSFLQTTQHPVWKLYNGISPLETMHAVVAFHFMSSPALNFFSTDPLIWTPAATTDLHQRVVEMVLGTDMRNHAKTVETVKTILSDGQVGEEDIDMLMVAILHAADLSNPMKSWHLYTEWAHRVSAEFFREGDALLQRGLTPPLPIFDRTNLPRFPEMQVGFMSFVVKPFVKEIALVLPPLWLQQLDTNIERMRQYCGGGVQLYEPLDTVRAMYDGLPWVDKWRELMVPQLTGLIHGEAALIPACVLAAAAGKGGAAVTPLPAAEAEPEPNASPVPFTATGDSASVAASIAAAAVPASAVAAFAAAVAQALHRAMLRLFAAPADSRLVVEELHEGFAVDVCNAMLRLRRDLAAAHHAVAAGGATAVENSVVDPQLECLLGSDRAGNEPDDPNGTVDLDWALFLMRHVWIRGDLHEDDDVDGVGDGPSAKEASSPGAAIPPPVDLHGIVRQATLTLATLVTQYVATTSFSTALVDTTTNRGMCVYFAGQKATAELPPPTSAETSSSVSRARSPLGDSLSDPPQRAQLGGVASGRASAPLVSGPTGQSSQPLPPRALSSMGGMPAEAEAEGDSRASPTLVGLRGLRSKLLSSQAQRSGNGLLPQLQKYFPPMFQTGWGNPNTALEKIVATSPSASRKLTSLLREQHQQPRHPVASSGGGLPPLLSFYDGSPTLDHASQRSSGAAFGPSTATAGSSSPNGSSPHMYRPSSDSPVRLVESRTSSIRVSSTVGSLRNGPTAGPSSGSASSRIGSRIQHAVDNDMGLAASLTSPPQHALLQASVDGGGMVTVVPGGGFRSPVHEEPLGSYGRSRRHHPTRPAAPSMEDVTFHQPLQLVFVRPEDDDDEFGDASTSSLSAAQLLRIAETGAAVPSCYLTRTPSMRSEMNVSYTESPR